MADKSFGVKELNLLNASGTPTVTSPNNLNLNANTVAISTSCTIGSNLDVDGTTNLDNVDIVGITTIRNASGNKLYEGSANASKLFHNGSERLQTETYGIDINGTLGADQINCSGVSTITIPANTNPHSSWDVVNNGASAYRFTGPGQDGAEDNPNIYLVRGQRYIFKVNASGHPFQLRVANGGAAYSDGVTNNGAQSGNVVINVQHDAPAQLYYQCTSHGGMVGNIYIVGGPQVISGVVTATTFVGNLTGNVTGNATGLSGTPNISAGTIAGSTGTFTGDLTIPDKIVHAGDTNTAIRFPAADTITAETGGSERFRILANGAVGINTSNFSSVLNNEVGLAIHGSSNDNCRINLSTPNKSNTLIGYYGLSNRFGVDVHNGLEIRDVEDSYATRLRIDSSGRVLIGTTTEGYNPDAQTLTIAESGNSGMTIRSGASSAGHIYFSDATSGAGEYVGQIGYNHSSNYLWFGANSNEKIRITNGGLDPSTDGATDLGNSSKRFRDLYLSSGIFLGGTTSSNELEDYEEGLWTPQMLDGNGSNYVITKDTNNCYYTKIGRMVFVYYVVTNAENGSKTGNLYFPPSCLPFTPSYSALGAGSFWVDHSSPSAGLGDIIGGLHNVGSSGVYFVKPTDKSGIGQASTRYLQHGQWSFGRPLYGSFSYKV